MPQKRKRYDKQFKIAAARVVLGGEMRAVDLVRELGIKDSTLRRWAQEHGEMGDPRVNLADGAFDVEARNRLWVDGIAYIGTGEGWSCLAAVIDAFHRKVVGWSMSGRITEKLVADALERRSKGRARPRASASSSTMTRVPSTLPGRSGAASSPTGSPDPCRGRATHGTTRSRKSFFKMLKRELVNGKGRKTREEAKQDVFEYIAPYYNRQRIHSSVGHNAPMRPRARCCLKKLIVPSKKP